MTTAPMTPKKLVRKCAKLPPTRPLYLKSISEFSNTLISTIARLIDIKIIENRR